MKEEHEYFPLVDEELVPLASCTKLLKAFLQETDSEYGFIGDILPGEGGAPYLKTRSITDISWDEESLAAFAPEGMIFSNLNSIFGQTMKTGKIYISNNPASDPIRGGLPKGHPPLHSYIGIPLTIQDRLIGMVGLANKPGGYSEQDVSLLKVLIISSATAIRTLQLQTAFNTQSIHLALLIQRIADGVITMSDAGSIVDVNPAMTKIFGYSSSELIGKPVTDLMPERYRAAHTAGLARFLNSGAGKIVGNISVQVQGLHKNGSMFDLNLRIYEIVISGSRYFSGVIQDPLKLIAEANSVQSLNVLENIIELSTNCFFSIDEKAVITRWNTAMSQASGIDGRDSIGKKITHLGLFDKTHEYVVEAAIESIYAKEQIGVDVEFSIMVPSGLNRVLKGSVIPIFSQGDVTGEIIGCFFSVSDITDKIENESRDLQAQKMQTFGQLAGGIARDFSNLLQIIGGNIDYIEEGLEKHKDIEPEMLEAIIDTKKATLQGREITQQLLSFARKRPMVLELVDLNVLIESNYRIFSKAMGGDIDLVFNPCLENLLVLVDVSQFVAAILELCINARDASNRTGDIFLNTKFLSDLAIDTAQISIQDQGIGMTEAELQQCTDPFYTSKASGTGLGLAMVNDLAISLHGRLDIISSLGKGTTVTLKIPLDSNYEKFEEMPSLTAEEEAGNDSILEEQFDSSPIVLVVEDEKNVRKFAVRCMERLGCRVIQAETAQQAIEILQTNADIDIVFSDIRMPGNLDGRDLANWVSSNIPATLIILATGYDDSKTETEQYIEVLRKPYTFEELEIILNAFTEARIQ
ncbi:MAG: PAS domain S-box-containing protein [Pseudohongiellaceae bacterium]|jgi:PAS domain S-box-containing protein